MNSSLHVVGRVFLFRVLPIAALLVAVAIVGAGFWSYREPAFVRIAQKQALRTGADSNAISRVEIVPWRGVRIDSLYLRWHLTDGRVVEFGARRVAINYHPVALLLGGRKLQRALEKSASRIRLKANDPLAAAAEAQSLVCNPLFKRAISGIATTDGWFRLSNRGAPSIESREVDLNLDLGSEDSASPLGALRAATIAFGGRYQVIRPVADLQITGNEIRISKAKGFFCDGTLRLDAVVDLFAKRLDRAECKVTGLSLEKWYETQPNHSGALSGKASSTFAADTSPLSWDSLSGRGDFKIKDLVARNLPLQKDLAALLTIPELSLLKFNAIGSDFTLSAGTLRTPNLKGNGDPLDVSASGWVSLANGTFKDSVACLLTKKFSRSLPEIVHKSLLPRDDERLAFECTVWGTFDNPSLTLNKEIVARAVQNVFEKLGNELNRFFK